MTEPQYLYLTTTGHVTGKSHEIEIWFVQYGNCYYLVSERRAKSHWVQNIRANPKISFRVGGVRFDGQGRVVDANELDLLEEVSRLMSAKYGWHEGMIVELCGVAI